MNSVNDKLMYDKMRILIVDDESLIVEMLSFMLAPGFEIHTASNGSEALEIIKSHPAFDLLISDIDMPIMSGFELINSLSAKALLTSKLPIVLISSSRSIEVDQLINENMVDVFLEKPFQIDELMISVNQLLKKRLN
jgi:two-component system response regulator ResD